MEITDQLIALPLSIFATVVGAVVIRWLSPKSKVIWAEPHGFTYLLEDAQAQGGTFNVWVDSIYVQNAGKKPAEDIEIFFNWKPQHLNFLPIIVNTPYVMEDGRYVLKIDSLAPGEWFQIERMEVAKQPPEVLRVRSRDGGEAKKVRMRPTRIYSKPINFLVGSLMLIGAFAIIYHTISFVLLLP